MKHLRILNLLARFCTDIGAVVLVMLSAICLGLLTGRVSQMSLTFLDTPLNLPLIG